MANENNQIKFITFHPSYSYEDFIEGITVRVDEKNDSSDKVQYSLRTGSFKDFCKKALGGAIGLSDEDVTLLSWKEVYEQYCAGDPVDFEEVSKYILIIDEINRGDMAKIFGELITLLEADKRIGADNEMIVTLPTSGDLFGVPPNLYIIATMNTADRSIALIDIALRRRFGFVEMNPDFEILRKEHLEKNKEKLNSNGVYGLLNKAVMAVEKINGEICKDDSIGRDRQIGHSYLFKVETVSDLHLAWRHEIFPLLEEYCYGDYAKINKVVFGKDSDTEWIGKSEGIKNIDNLDRMLNAINQVNE